MLVDAYASRPHYRAHLGPVFDLLANRGTFYGTGRNEPRLGARDDTRPCLVAGWADAERVRGPLILVEHGAGQTYGGDPRMVAHPSYAGGAGWGRAILFVVPGRYAGDKWRAAYPHIPVVEVGCPRLDILHRQQAAADATRVHTPGLGGFDSPACHVGVTWHWDWRSLPETRTAFGHYADALPALAERFDVVGHAHPRMWRQAAATYRKLGVATEPDFDRFLSTVDVLCVDNSSAGPEFASLGRPVVWLSAPWYRRDVDHGGRFWDWAGGGMVHVEHPGQLVEMVAGAFPEPPEARESREQMVSAVYAHTDGLAAVRAAEAVQGVSLGDG